MSSSNRNASNLPVAEEFVDCQQLLFSGTSQCPPVVGLGQGRRPGRAWRRRLARHDLALLQPTARLVIVSSSCSRPGQIANRKEERMTTCRIRRSSARTSRATRSESADWPTAVGFARRTRPIACERRTSVGFKAAGGRERRHWQNLDAARTRPVRSAANCPPDIVCKVIETGRTFDPKPQSKIVH